MPRIDSHKFYTSAILMHGTSPKGVNWTSKQTQELRFKILLNFLPQHINSLADAGCGFGDFFNYLNLNNRVPKTYIGIDSLKNMQKIASKNTKQNIILADITKDTLPSVEYYVCSGAMNILNTFETHLFIRNCFEASQKGFIFNILHGDVQSDTYNYIKSAQIDSIAKKLNVKRVEIQDDYMQNDITVGFFHV